MTAEASLERVGVEGVHGIEVQPITLGGDRMHGNDVGVPDLGEDARLAHETLDGRRGGELGSEHLDRHRGVEGHVAGEVHRAHAAHPELPEQFVIRCQRRAEPFEEGRHHVIAVGNIRAACRKVKRHSCRDGNDIAGWSILRAVVRQ